MSYGYVGDEVDELVDSVSGDMLVGAEQGAPQRARVMQRTQAQTLKRAPLGFGTYNLAAGASVTLTSRAQRAFHPDKLLVTASQLGATITSIRVGDEEQLLGGTVPAELYGESALADQRPDDFSPAPAGIDFSITISNGAATATTGAVGMKGHCKR